MVMCQLINRRAHADRAFQAADLGTLPQQRTRPAMQCHAHTVTLPGRAPPVLLAHALRATMVAALGQAAPTHSARWHHAPTGLFLVLEPPAPLARASRAMRVVVPGRHWQRPIRLVWKSLAPKVA